VERNNVFHPIRLLQKFLYLTSTTYSLGIPQSSKKYHYGRFTGPFLKEYIAKV
jgi:hypothetical protein